MEPKPADTYLQKEYWKDVVIPVERAGRLDHIPARKAVTKKERDTAQKQNYEVTRKNFGMPDGYDKIRWNSQKGKEHE